MSFTYGKVDKATEMDLFNRFKAGDIGAKNQLLMSLRPIVMNHILRYKNSNIPLPVLEGRAYGIIDKALPKYDPSKSQLNTFVFTQLQQLKRTVSDYADIGYIPEQRAGNIRLYKNVLADLREKLYREPTTKELAEELMWPIKEVERIRQELRGSLIEDIAMPVAVSERNYEQDKIEFVYDELNPQQQLVMEYTMGLHGRPVMTLAQTAQALTMTVDQVRKIKDRISEKFKAFD